MKFKHYQTKSTFLTDLGDNKIVSGDICFIKDAQQIYTHGTYYDCSSGSGSQSDWDENDTTADDYIKNRTHYVIGTTYTDKWNQSNVEVGSGSSSPGAYSGTFTVTAGNKYRVIITNGNQSKTYNDIEAVYNTSLNGILLNKNWSNPMQGAEAQSDAFYILVQASSVILASVDVYGSNCTVQVSEITENVKKLDRKYLPALNEIDNISSSRSGSVTTVTITETEGATTSFQISDGENGTDGTDGTDGKSAYEIAVENGYVGTESQWLASLKGDSGVTLGQVAMTQTITGDDDKVPSDKAVRDGVEVWRSVVTDYIYESSNIAFDGTNVVDTEINLYNPEIDFEIKMTISDLTWLSGAANNSNARILSCNNTESPYRGFALHRGASASKITLYLDGSRRFASTINTGSGSTNTFYIKKVGNDYTFQVNGGTLNTYTSTVDNSTAFTLRIGGTDSKSSFTLNSITVKNLNGQDVQLYSDYAKDKPICPKTTIPAVEGLLSTLNNVKIGAGWSTTANTKWLRLNPTQVTKLNEQDGMTLFISAKTTGSYNYRYCNFFSAKKKASGDYSTSDTDGLRITTDSTQHLIVNGVTFSQSLYFMNIAIEVNKRLGRVRIWNEGYMVEEKINDAFKTAYFIDNDGVFTFNRGDYAQIWYNYQLYSGEIITDWKSTQLDRVIGSASPSVSYVSGFDKVAYTESKVCSSANNISTAYYKQLTGSTKTYGTDGAYVDFVNSGAATSALGGSNRAFGCCWTCVVPFDVNSGTFKAYRNKPCGDGAEDGSVYVYYRNQDGTQGAEIEDYTSIGQGQYLFVGNGVKGYVSPYLEQVTYPSSIRVYPKTFLFAGCILNVRMDALYGDRFKDYITWDDFIMYSDNILATEIMPYITTEKADSLIDTNSTKSQFPSRLSMHDDKIYMLMHNPTTGVYTWKQINNS